MRAQLALLLALTAACVSTETPADRDREVQRISAEDGTEIVFEVRGQGGRPLVFLHGWCGQRGHWEAQMRTFSPRQQCIAIDLAGHGESGREREMWGVAGLGADVARVIDHLELEGAVLVGHSMGGPVALAAAAATPERVALVVAVDTLHDVSFRVPEHNLQQAIAAYSRDFEGTLQTFASQMFRESASESVRVQVIDDMLASTPGVAISLLQDFLHYDMSAALGAATIPVVGINSDQRPTNVEANRQVDEDYEVIIVDELGHYVMLESPTRFDAALLSVMLRVE